MKAHAGATGSRQTKHHRMMYLWAVCVHKFLPILFWPPVYMSRRGEEERHFLITDIFGTTEASQKNYYAGVTSDEIPISRLLYFNLSKYTS